MGERKRKRRTATRRRRRQVTLVGRILTLMLAIPAAYMTATLIGSFVPVNSGWKEPAQGVTIYLADNGIHTDIIMPLNAEGLDWMRLFPPSDFRSPDPNASFIAFGSGEKRVYLDTPTWWDIRPRTIWSALAGGDRVLHVELVPAPYYAVRQVRLRPEEYRRLWSAIRADMELDARGMPKRLDHPGYGSSDAFYAATGKANAIRTCNSVAADWLRLAGVKTSIWPPFAPGLIWRYRDYNGLALLGR
jgi:uncharacterized protein (TIGR02117 family)